MVISNSLRTLFLGAIMLAASSHTATAQRIADDRSGAARAEAVRVEPSDIRALKFAVITSSDTAKSNGDRGTRFLARMGIGALLWWPGAFGGALIGASTAGPCGCDDPGLGEAIVGALIGGTVATAVGASFIHQRKCSIPERVFFASVGSALGAVFGGAVAGITGGVTFPIMIPAGAGLGAAVALQDC